MDHLGARLVRAANGTGWLTVIGLTETTSLPWAEVHAQAERAAAWFLGMDYGPGDPLLIYGRNSLDVVVAIRAAWLTGISVTVAALPIRRRNRPMMREWFTSTRLSLNPAIILCDDEHLSALAQDIDGFVMSFGNWRKEMQMSRSAEVAKESLITGDIAAIIQPTSGTTGTPKEVIVPRRCLEANQEAIARGLALNECDRALSWLPLSHDMGLVGMLGVAMLTGVDLVLMDPHLFVGNPFSWMGWTSHYEATIICGPDSMYGLAASLLQQGPSVDLSHVRVAINGSEPIDVDSFRGFLEVGHASQLLPSTAFAVYGLAEATLAVTFPRPDAGLLVDRVDRAALSKGFAIASESAAPSQTRQLACLGRAVQGVSIQIRNRDQIRSDREIGEIHVSGSSVTPGYLGDDPSTRDSELERWLPTGDLGYIANGQLVVCGRSKDTIIIGGRNFYPEDIERAASKLDVVWRGNVAAFGIAGGRGRRESIVVMAESQDTDSQLVKKTLSSAILQACDVSVADVKVVNPRQLPKTLSGKISRTLCRDMYLQGKLAP